MTYLFDTNVLSELRKPPRRAYPAVKTWAASQDPDTLWISAITVFEIQLGLARIERQDPTQAAVLTTWLTESVLRAFDGRILPVDVPVARRAAWLHVPDPKPGRDVFLAATALHHDLTVVTRNSRDFASFQVPVINPWE